MRPGGPVGTVGPSKTTDFRAVVRVLSREKSLCGLRFGQIVPAAVGATLYVWSQKEILPADIGVAARTRLSMTGVDMGEYQMGRVLPEEQQTAVDVVLRVASEGQVPVEQVDLGEERHILGRREAHQKGWAEFPVLVAPDGTTLVGSAAFSEQAVSEVLARRGSPLR